MEVKRKRGRPRKNPIPEEVSNIIEDTRKKQEAIEKEEQERKEIIQEYQDNVNKSVQWDVKIGDNIEYFDSNLSYELTGYRPINENQGFDFDPSWFTQARDTFNRTGRYTQFNRKSKAFADFWRQEYIRCKYGMTVNGYTVTGDHYFFLNYFKLEDLNSTSEAGAGRNIIFPHFMEGQYQWFHYLSLAKKLRLNACMMKAREANKAAFL